MTNSQLGFGVCVYVCVQSFFFFFLDGEGKGQMDVRFMGGKKTPEKWLNREKDSWGWVG